jgi:hypothetical protein
MPSPFVTAARVAQAAVYAFHGESFDFAPMAKAGDVNAPAIVDPDRAPALGLVGIYFEKDARPLIANGYDPRTDQRPGVMNRHPRVEFSADCAVAQIVFRAGDLLTRTSNARRYRVAAVHTLRTGVQVCEVNSLG